MTPRDRRALRLGAAAVVIGSLLVWGLPSGWRAWRAGGEELAGRRALLARAESALSDLPVIEERSAATRARLVALAPALVSGATEAEAQADLNGRLALVANRERTRLLRADPVTDTGRVGSLRRVRLRIEVESDWSGLVGFLRGVVADPAVLRVTAVTLRGAEVVVLTSGPEVLSAQVEVTGWYLEKRPVTREGE